MDIDTKVLDILFRKVSPSRVLERLRKSGSVVDLEADRNTFLQFAITGLDGYSLDEQNLIFSRLQSEAARFALHQAWVPHHSHTILEEETIAAHHLSLPSLAFYSVLSLADRVLTQHDKEPLCRIEQVLPWREAFLLMGQDLFVCAYLAQKDLHDRWMRNNFTWPAVIRTDHVELNRLLKSGVAENHQHLFGSSQTFALSWCNLMNYPESHKAIGVEFDKLYQPFTVPVSTDVLISSKERVRYACLCRSHLFRWIKSKDKSCSDGCPKWKNSELDIESCQGSTEAAHCSRAKITCGGTCCTNASLWSWLFEFHPELHLKAEIGNLRVLYGAKVPQPVGDDECLDYALEEHVFHAAPDAAYRSLAGERSLLYQCFRAFLQGEMSERTQLVFYLYILLKAMFRSELIQVNKQVGFRNFSNYQNRKDILCDRPCYWAELIRMALNAPLNEGAVKSLETRVTPKKSVAAYVKRVSEVDTLKRFADIALEQLQAPEGCVLPPIETVPFWDSPYFFVFHFIKGPDPDPNHLSSLDLVCRHQKLRKNIRKQAIALAKTLSQSDYFYQRVRGIDSASHEIGCPPEVFASVFRFLRGFRTSDFTKGSLFSKSVMPALSATYHAGEDYLDIAGGLRTIDEAVTFLEMRRGDRIGHALALGVNPEIHYAMKGKRVFMRKQERLDDLVWLLYRSRDLGVEIGERMYSELKKAAQTLLLEIYGKAIEENAWHITLFEYYCSMRLRADDPARYIRMKYEPPSSFGSPYEEYTINLSEPELDKYRNSASMAGMYYYYHYGKREKVCGNQICEVIIEPRYIHLIRKMQDAMQEYLTQKGLIIECNPSSNVLIGTFSSYKNHPIFRFNNTDLETNHDKYINCSQLKVCVNTDDLGVFDTSQEFEYSLLFHALSNMHDDGGKKLYKEGDILRYLDNIRKMGHDATFPKAKQP